MDGNNESRTYTYRKVMKPMLERKRRARINRCLDELKELMSEEGDVSKLEKADVLELTVRHLHTLQRRGAITVTGSHARSPESPESPEPAGPAGEDRRAWRTYLDGFGTCAAAACCYLRDVDAHATRGLRDHLRRAAHIYDAVPCEGEGEGEDVPNGARERRARLGASRDSRDSVSPPGPRGECRAEADSAMVVVPAGRRHTIERLRNRILQRRQGRAARAMEDANNGDNGPMWRPW